MQPTSAQPEESSTRVSMAAFATYLAESEESQMDQDTRDDWQVYDGDETADHDA